MTETISAGHALAGLIAWAVIGFIAGRISAEPNTEEELILRKHGYRVSKDELRKRLQETEASK